MEKATLNFFPPYRKISYVCKMIFLFPKHPCLSASGSFVEDIFKKNLFVCFHLAHRVKHEGGLTEKPHT